jgi:hypothetical protein
MGEQAFLPQSHFPPGDLDDRTLTDDQEDVHTKAFEVLTPGLRVRLDQPLQILQSERLDGYDRRRRCLHRRRRRCDSARYKIGEPSGDQNLGRRPPVAMSLDQRLELLRVGVGVEGGAVPSAVAGTACAPLHPVASDLALGLAGLDGGHRAVSQLPWRPATPPEPPRQESGVPTVFPQGPELQERVRPPTE